MTLKSALTRTSAAFSGNGLVACDKNWLATRLLILRQSDTKLRASGVKLGPELPWAVLSGVALGAALEVALLNALGVALGAPPLPPIGIARNATFPAIMMAHFNQQRFRE